MAGTIPCTKETKAGKLSFVLPEGLKGLICLAIDYRLEREELPLYQVYLLEEARETLSKEGRTKMRKSEFFAVFHPEQMYYISDQTNTLIRAHLGDFVAQPDSPLLESYVMELLGNPTKKPLPGQL